MIWNSKERAKDCWSSYTQPICQHSWNLTLRWLQQTWWLLSTHRLSPVSLLAEDSCCLVVPSPGGFRRICLHPTATGPIVRVWAHHGGPVLLADGSSGWARVTIVAKETWERESAEGASGEVEGGGLGLKIKGLKLLLCPQMWSCVKGISEAAVSSWDNEDRQPNG